MRILKKEDKLDLENLNAFLNGDSRGFSFLYDKYAKILFSLNCKYTKNDVDIEDCIQETFIKIFQKRVIFKPEKTTVYNYILSTYRTTRIDMYRTKVNREQRLKNVVVIDSYPCRMLENLMKEESEEMVKEEINTLPYKVSEAIKGIYLGGLTQAELAVKTFTTQASISQRHKKGLLLLKDNSVFQGVNNA